MLFSIFLLGMIGLSNVNRPTIDTFRDDVTETDDGKSKLSLQSDAKENEEYFISSPTQSHTQSNKHIPGDNFVTHLSNQDDLGKIPRTNIDNMEELLKPTTDKVDPEFNYLFENPELNGFDEEYMANLLVYSLGMVIGPHLPTKTEETDSDEVLDTDDDDVERCISTIQL